MPQPNPRRRLHAIRAATLTTPDLDRVEEAYGTVLGYEVVQRRTVSRAEAQSWGAPGAEGRKMALLAPASGEPVFLRFIEDEAARGWRALQTYGWNVCEFVVQDVETLAQRLSGSAFTVIGPPKGLTRFPMIKAMQVLGPAGECCYFTEVGPGSGLTLAPAKSFVGRIFIVVAAGPDANQLAEAYQAFDNEAEAPVKTPVRVISDAFGLAPDTLHAHGLVKLGEGALVELDAYPPGARARAWRDGELEPGLAMVSFDVDALEGLPLTAPPAPCELPSIQGLSGVMIGKAGERLELIARHQTGSGAFHADP
jgi:hypothetical protein